MNRNLIIILALGLILLAAAACTTVNPVSGEKQFTLLSEEQEKNLGAELYPQYTQQFNGLFQDNNLQQYVTTVGRKVASFSHRPNLNYEFNVVNSSEANAYALPGGKITITRGLLGRLEDEAQLASVFGHEVGHVAALHTVQSYTRGIMANVLLAGVGLYLEKKQVKNREYYMLGSSLVTNLVLMKYSRDQERQSDALGIDYTAKSGYDPAQFIGAMQVLKSLEKREPHKFEALIRTHPLNDERIASAQQAFQAKYAQYAGVRNQDQFRTALTTIKQTEAAYALYDKGEASMNNQHVEAALGYLKDAADQAPGQAIIRAAYGRALYESGRPAAAYTELDRASQIYPDQFHIRLFKGMTDLETARFQEAISDLTRANQLIPDQAPVQFFLGKTYESINQRDNAAKFYQKFLSMQDSGAWVNEARAKLESWGYLQKQQ